MDVVKYDGTGATQTISGLNFSPDFVWLKRRDSADSHQLFDIIRGATNFLGSDTTNAEQTLATLLTSFNSDGFSIGSYYPSSSTFAAFCWDAGSSTVTNTAGSISSQVRANASAGFSVVTYTGNGTAGATIGHGLGVAPEMIIVKCRNVARNWTVGHQGIASDPWTDYLMLNSTAAAGDLNTVWNDTAPSSTVFTVGTSNGVNANTETHVAYCFAPVAGYSSFGSYTGNGSADGPFVFCNFRPRWIMLKKTDTVSDWWIYDTARQDYNVMGPILYPNSSSAEFATDASIFGRDLLSNGFKVRNANITVNGNGSTYIYAAFAEHPFAYSRAR